MKINRPMISLHVFFERVMRMAYLNVLWITFTMVGFLVLGIFPATTALCAVIRKWFKDGEEIPIFKVFWETYRRHFWVSNVLGLILFSSGYVLYFYLMVFSTMENLLGIFLNGLLISVGAMYVIILTNIFPVLVNYDLKGKQYLKYAFVIGITNMHLTLLTFGSVFSVAYIVFSFPFLIPFFSVNLLGFVVMWIAEYVFKKLENRRDKIGNK